MNPYREVGKLFLVAGTLLVAVGTVLVLGARLPFRLGRLPGDIVYQGRNTSFYFPIVSCIVLSVVFTLVMWLVGQFRR